VTCAHKVSAAQFGALDIKRAEHNRHCVRR
jgi:hypothetical protein